MPEPLERARALLRRRGARLRGPVERRLVWILGSPRTGSTWLLNLLKADRRVTPIDEPTIGAHLAILMLDIVSVHSQQVPPERLRVNDLRSDLPSYFFSQRYEEVWRPRLRELLLRRFEAELEDRASEREVDDPIAVIKEPVGSQGADLLMSLLPASRMIFLLRDGRDVIDSELDAFAAGGWVSELIPEYTKPGEHRLFYLRDRAHAWLARTLAVQRAYESHDPRLRRLIRYEELLEDTEGVADSLARWLGLDHEMIVAGADALSFSQIERGKRGPGKFARAATPGLWRENLSEDEQQAIERIIGPKLRELGYA